MDSVLALEFMDALPPVVLVIIAVVVVVFVIKSLIKFAIILGVIGLLIFGAWRMGFLAF